MTRAVAGAMSTRSAVWPRCVCGIGCSSSHNDVWAFSEPSASNVVRPTNRNAPSVNTGMTWAPSSTRRRQTSIALYAAIPPETPRTIRRPPSTSVSALLGGFALAGLVLEHWLGVDRNDLARRHLLEGDGQRLPGYRGDLRRDDRAEPFTELAEVRVDLPGPLGP